MPPDFFEVRARKPRYPRGEIRLAPRIVYPDSALGRVTNALGWESGLVLGERIIEKLVKNGGTLVLAGHPGNGKSILEQSFESGLRNYACLAYDSPIQIHRANIHHDITLMKKVGWSSNVLTWSSDQWNELDGRFQRRLEYLHEANPRSVILVETGGTNYTVGGVERNQGGRSLQWLVSTQDPIVLFLRAASRSVPALAGITREMALEFASSTLLPRRLRHEYYLSFVGLSGSTTRGMLSGAPRHVIEGFELEMENQLIETNNQDIERMLQRIQRPKGIPSEDAKQAAMGAALYALELEKLGLLSSDEGLSTVLYTYPPTLEDPLRVRMPVRSV